MADMAIRLAHEPRPQARGDALADRVRSAAADLPRTCQSSRTRAIGRRPSSAPTRSPLPRPARPARARGRLAGAARRAAPARRGLFFGDRPLCTVLRPRFLTPAQYRFLQRPRRRCCSARSTRRHEPRLADPAFRDQFRLRDWEDAAPRARPRLRRAQPDARLDAFFVSERRSSSSPSTTPRRRPGAAYNDALAELFLRPAGDARVPAALPTCARSRPGPACCTRCSTPSSSGAAGATRRASPSSTGARCRRTASSCSSTTTSRRMGIELRDRRPARGRVPRRQAARPATTTSPHLQARADQRAGRARRHGPPGRAGGARPGRVHGEPVPLQDAAQEGEPRRAVRRAERATCSRRRAAGDRRRTSRGRASSRSGRRRSTAETVDLVPVRRWRTARRLVLKPNDDYGGKGIVLGWTVDAADVGGAPSATALAEPYVVQERIALPERAVSRASTTARCTSIDRMLDTAPFVASATSRGRLPDAISTDGAR